MRDLKETLTGLLFAHKSARDVFHKDGEVHAEPVALLPEEGTLGDAARVNRGEGNAVGLVKLGVQDVGQHHEAELGILVGLGPVEAVAISHGDGIFESRFESLQILKISDGVHTATSDCIVITGDRAHGNNAWIRGSRHVGHEQTDHEEMAQEVDLHRLLVPVGRPFGVW